ncbi:NAD-dependent epimerase/dehydratase family protein [Cognatitamlana onchidii]|uniref:NAD-dependent epimerase/dehydratase family protein n=1 Tax=Cognatitamlana onchidii TaxID=2562860 RepID=UPI0010A66AB4|nr:NAD-dependent epimerase/dehydratase family protein [Algibacter onchidii]
MNQFSSFLMDAATKKVLVTGANGLLGTNTVLKLLKDGFYVRAFVRNKRKYLGGSHVSLELFEGDINISEHLEHAISGCQYVIHIAAITDQSFLKYSDYYNINVKVVKDIIHIAIRNGLQRIIYVGTANQFGYGSLSDLGDETKKMRYPFSKTFYSRSKKEAHDYIKTIGDEIEIVVVNPAYMIGAFDTKPSSGKIVLMGLKNRFVLCPPGGKNFVCVSDVAKGIIKALKYGKNKGAYLLASQNLSFYEFFKILKYYSNNRFLIIKVPKEALTLLGYFGKLLRFFRVKTDFSVENMKILCIESYYSNQKAVRDLKLDFKPIDHGVKEALLWFEGRLK